MRNKTQGLITAAIVFMLVGIGSATANAQTRRTQTALTRDSVVQQPLFSAYKGVSIGMTAAETRAKLGAPQVKESDQDYYVISENERVQVAYNPAGKVVTISIDYIDGVGAPDHKDVVGGELQPTRTGGLYNIVRYESAGYWVSYNRTVGPVLIVTITIQKI